MLINEMLFIGTKNLLNKIILMLNINLGSIIMQVLVRKETEVKVGDIVLVPYGGHLILHRVYAINGSHLTLMGDGNLKGTEELDASEVLGTAVQIIKPNCRCRKPHKAWLWRHTLPVRRYMLKLRRKWHQLRKLNPE